MHVVAWLRSKLFVQTRYNLEMCSFNLLRSTKLIWTFDGEIRATDTSVTYVYLRLINMIFSNCHVFFLLIIWIPKKWSDQYNIKQRNCLTLLVNKLTRLPINIFFPLHKAKFAWDDCDGQAIHESALRVEQKFRIIVFTEVRMFASDKHATTPTIK